MTRPESGMTDANALMTKFAQRGRRYLWTDAFAVCNWLALGREDLARQLVDDVHRTLGCGTPEHPTRGGLRIGKPLPERGPTDRYDEHLEWERDGQYFHYLTKWMHALDVMSRATGEQKFHAWAVELATSAHRAFVYDAHGGKRMYWKMSIDLSRPLVATMGHHDPLDGFITAVQLGDVPPDLFTDYVSMLEPSRFATADPLGLGGLLVDACRVAQLIDQHTWLRDVDLLEPLLEGALLGLRHYLHTAEIDGSPHRRLAFRELGLAIGLAGIEMVRGKKAGELAKFLPLRERIQAFWLNPENRDARTYREHADINDVMLATSLEPSGFLVLPPTTSSRRASVTSSSATAS